MKKLLLIAILMLALVVTVVACDKKPATDDTTVADTTVENPTEAPTEDATTEAPTEDATTEEVTTEEPTEEVTTEEPTEKPTQKPEDPTEPPTEEQTTADPADPVWIADPDAVVNATKDGAAAYIAGAEITEEGGRKFVRITVNGGDSQFVIGRNLGTMPSYLAISYRTNGDRIGEMFVGTDNGPNGQNDHGTLYWNMDNNWNLMIFDLSTIANVKDGNIGYFRLDPFTDTTAGYIDIEYIALFNTAEYAMAYDFEMHKAPMWDADKSIITHQSFDQFYLGDGHQDDAVKEDLNFYHAANKPSWDMVADMTESEYTCLTYWGWIAVTADTIGQFGYQVNMDAPIFDDAWTHATEQGVLDAAVAFGGVTGSRMKITIATADLEGENTIRILYKDANGAVVCLNEVTVIMPVKPTHYENYAPDIHSWTVSGHNPAINDASNGMVAAGGVEYGALLHQGSINLGEIDLSKYSKVIIYWGCDNSEVTVNHYNNNAQNRIMLLNAEMVNVMSPAEETIIASYNYELTGWAVNAIEIDLTGIDYNGPVYVAIDTLPGTFALFSSIEFVGGEIDYSKPEEPTGPVLIGWQTPDSTVRHISQDGFRYLDGDQNVVQEIVTPGAYGQFDGTLEYTKGGAPFVADFGWVAMNAETFQFGYIIDNGEPIMNDAYATPASDPVKAAAASVGASNCSGFYGVLAVAFLQTGEHNIKFVMQQNGAEYVVIREYTIIVSE